MGAVSLATIFPSASLAVKRLCGEPIASASPVNTVVRPEVVFWKRPNFSEEEPLFSASAMRIAFDVSIALIDHHSQ
jgi:hypothetical protein